jgi:AraC family transcriptional regulator
MESELISKEAFTVVGMNRRGKNQGEELARLWRTFLSRANEIKGIVDRQVSYGLIGNFDEENGEFDYMAGYEVVEASAIPEGMSSWKVPKQRYAVFPCSLPDLMETLQQIYGTWLPESGYQRGNGPEFEHYGQEFNPEDPCSIMYVYIPVTPVSSENE